MDNSRSRYWRGQKVEISSSKGAKVSSVSLESGRMETPETDPALLVTEARGSRMPRQVVPCITWESTGGHQQARLEKHNGPEDNMPAGAVTLLPKKISMFQRQTTEPQMLKSSSPHQHWIRSRWEGLVDATLPLRRCKIKVRNKESPWWPKFIKLSPHPALTPVMQLHQHWFNIHTLNCR